MIVFVHINIKPIIISTFCLSNVTLGVERPGFMHALIGMASKQT